MHATSLFTILLSLPFSLTLPIDNPIQRSPRFPGTPKPPRSAIPFNEYAPIHLSIRSEPMPAILSQSDDSIPVTAMPGPALSLAPDLALAIASSSKLTVVEKRTPAHEPNQMGGVVEISPAGKQQMGDVEEIHGEEKEQMGDVVEKQDFDHGKEQMGDVTEKDNFDYGKGQMGNVVEKHGKRATHQLAKRNWLLVIWYDILLATGIMKNCHGMAYCGMNTAGHYLNQRPT